jgi:hypothetical protein
LNFFFEKQRATSDRTHETRLAEALRLSNYQLQITNELVFATAQING